MAPQLYDVSQHEIAALLFGQIKAIRDDYYGLLEKTKDEQKGLVYAQMNRLTPLYAQRAILIGKMDDFFESQSFYIKTRLDLTLPEWHIFKQADLMAFQLVQSLHTQHIVSLRPHHFLNQSEEIDQALDSLVKILDQVESSNCPDGIKEYLLGVVCNSMSKINKLSEQVQSSLVPLFAQIVEDVANAKSEYENFREDLTKQNRENLFYEMGLSSKDLDHIFAGDLVEKELSLISVKANVSLSMKDLTDQQIHLLREGGAVDVFVQGKYPIRLYCQSLEDAEE